MVDSLDTKEALIECEPDIFFTTPHYDGYAMVLIRLEAIDVKRAKTLITESYRLRAPRTLVKAQEATRAKKKVRKPRKR